MSNRVEWIDNAKGVGLLLVILGHLHVPFLSAWIYTYHMPLFFFLSGAVFTSKKYNPVEFVERRINSLVIPYFVLGLVIFAFYCLVYAIKSQPAEEYLAMFKEFILQRHYWTIWFLAALFLTELIYYFVDYFFSKYSLAVTVISLFLAISGFLYYRIGGTGLLWNLDIALIAQFFYHLGHNFKNARKFQQCFFSTNKLRSGAIILFLVIVNVICAKLCVSMSGHSLDMSIGMYGNEPLTLVSSIAGILAICLLSYHIHWSPIKWLGRNTMIIFSWHSRIGIVALDMICAYFGIFQATTTNVLFARALIYFVILLIAFSLITLQIKKSRHHKLFGI